MLLQEMNCKRICFATRAPRTQKKRERKNGKKLHVITSFNVHVSEVNERKSVFRRFRLRIIIFLPHVLSANTSIYRLNDLYLLPGYCSFECRSMSNAHKLQIDLYSLMM